ncbi:MAG: hypothetical protein RMM17_09970 [Acidobacteriota bacterium]|nr:hypothetical protein [Blastocatellia bacterium]MDW8412995.1 hypothetical protein [Acidobacteriota bacterium]
MLLLLVATEAELWAVRRAMPASRQDVSLLMTGMGSENASFVLQQALCQYKPTAVLVLGLAGALSKALTVGEVVVYSACRDEKGRSFSVSHKEVVTYLRDTPLRVSVGVGLTLPKMVCSTWEKSFLSAEAIAVDMESYGILEVASNSGVAVSVARVISDDALRDLPDLSQAITPEYKLDSYKVLRSFLSQPIAAARFVHGVGKSLQILTVLAGLLVKRYSAVSKNNS